MPINLAGISVAFICASILMLLVSAKLDQHAADEKIKMETSPSMLMMKPQNAVALLLTYAAIAFSQDLALEWLASIAVLICFSASLLRRGIAMLMARREAPKSAAEADEAAGDDDDSDGNNASDSDTNEESTLTTAGHMAELFSDILIYVSALDLLVLFVMAFIEKVIPYYLGLALN